MTQIEDGDTILLDSGTTALDLAELLKDIHNLTVITNDLQIALKLQKIFRNSFNFIRWKSSNII